MNPFLKILISIPLILYYILEAIVLLMVPNSLRRKEIKGEAVLITGAGSGIGRLLAIRFAKLGTRLVLLDINFEGLKETKELIGEENCGVYLYECDVSSRKAIYDVAAKIKEDVGDVNILVNNAGIVTGKKFLECQDEAILKTFQVNTLAHFWTCKAFLPPMMKANHGHLVFVASLAGFSGVSGLTDYCASKHAVVGFEESLRLELYEDGCTGVKTTVVCPYLVNTGLFEGFRAWIHGGLSPEYVADKIIDAVLIDQEVLILPAFMALLVVLKSMLPRRAMVELHEFSGLTGCMDEFKGRKKE